MKLHYIAINPRNWFSRFLFPNAPYSCRRDETSENSFLRSRNGSNCSIKIYVCESGVNTLMGAFDNKQDSSPAPVHQPPFLFLLSTCKSFICMSFLGWHNQHQKVFLLSRRSAKKKSPALAFIKHAENICCSLNCQVFASTSMSKRRNRFCWHLSYCCLFRNSIFFIFDLAAVCVLRRERMKCQQHWKKEQRRLKREGKSTEVADYRNINMIVMKSTQCC